jgi:hypothetical protein
MKIDGTRELRDALRGGPYAWPGGYPMFYVTHDGDTLHPDCVKRHYRAASHAIRHGEYDRIVEVDINWESPDMYCAICQERIESAYAEDDAP